MLFYMKKEIQERLAGLSIAFESTKGIVHFRQMCMPELLLIQLPFVQEDASSDASSRSMQRPHFRSA